MFSPKEFTKDETANAIYNVAYALMQIADEINTLSKRVGGEFTPTLATAVDKVASNLSSLDRIADKLGR